MTGDVYGGVLLMVRDEERERREAAARLRVLEARVGVLEERVGVGRPRPPPDDVWKAIVEARLQALMAALDVADRDNGEVDDDA